MVYNEFYAGHLSTSVFYAPESDGFFNISKSIIILKYYVENWRKYIKTYSVIYGIEMLL